MRARLLRFFRADPEHFDLIFTGNTTASIKLVADAFRDMGAGFWYGYQRDAHTSLVGVREYASEAKCFESDLDLETFLKGDDHSADEARRQRVGLFAWPAQSNMNGRRLPLDLAARIRASAQPGQTTYTMLDAAAYCTTGQVDLSNVDTSPDFVALSLHKIFGFPDLGALIVRKSAGDVFKCRRYFGGGTVEMVTVMREGWVSRKEHCLHEQLEDGTLPFHQIVALDSALDVHAELYGSMANITRHTSALAANLYKRLRALRHAGGLPVCEIYKDPRAQYGNAKTQGPTVAFNIRNAQGGWIGKSEVEALAITRGIHLRTGGVCNPGGIASSCALEHWEMRRNFAEGMRCGDNFDVLGGKPTGVVRVSLGAMSTQQDVDKVLDFIEAVFVETELDINPYQFSQVAANAQGEATVEALSLFPVRGCAGWKIPYYVSWGIGDRGLVWDREWCIISKENRVALQSSLHPRMRLIKPYINAERGTLRLTGPKASIKAALAVDEGTGACVAVKAVSSLRANGLEMSEKSQQVAVVVIEAIEEAHTETEEELEVEISLWESPDDTSPDLALPGVPLADAYASPAVAEFCSAVLGVPCTLARFRDYRKMAKETPAHAKSLPLSERSVTMAVHSDDAHIAGNVNVTGTATWQSRRYVQIGNEYFENPAATDDPDTEPVPLCDLVHLRNTYDRSRAAQNPVIAAGDAIRAFTADEAARDPGLQACVASTFVEGHMCPVWDCRKAFSTTEALHAHFPDHRHARPKPHMPKPAQIQVLQMAVNLPPLSEKLMAASAAAAASVQAPIEVQTPTSTFSRRSTRRQSWRNKLSTFMNRPNSLILGQRA